MAALNYGARASFIRIPSPRCSLSGGIKEEDTQSGFSLRPYWQHTQKTALTAAEGDSGGGGGDGGEEWGRGGRQRWAERKEKNARMGRQNEDRARDWAEKRGMLRQSLIVELILLKMLKNVILFQVTPTLSSSSPQQWLPPLLPHQAWDPYNSR